MVKKVLWIILVAGLLSACIMPVQAATMDEGINDSEASISVDVEMEEQDQIKPVKQKAEGSENDPLVDKENQYTKSENEEENPVEDETSTEPEAINPLSGLPVENPQNLLLPPALVSITNFPPTARPQAGLSFSPVVFELYIGDGMTRYLAIFYGDYPKSEKMSNEENLQTELSEGMMEPEPVASIGPIRSGRLPYESVRKLFNGFIVMASAYSKVADQISDFVNVFGDDNMDPNSALISVDDLELIAKDNGNDLGDASLNTMVFDPLNPEGGKVAHSLWIFYAYKNQVFWRYNEGDGTYHRWQDNADGVTFIEQTDRLNGDPIAYENVIVLFADHEVENQYLIDIDLLYVKRGKALLFRDGSMHEVYWTTKSEEYEKTTGKLRPIRFVDAEGNPFPLKPGQTWIELVPNYNVYWETVDSEKYNQLVAGRSKGSGYWGLYFELDD